MFRLRTATLLGALAGLFGVFVIYMAVSGANASGHRSSSAVIADCLGRGVSAPPEYVPACGDGNLVLKSLRWHRWGDTRATATGTAAANDCRPNCVGGHFHRYSVTVIADHLTGRGAHPSYRRLVITAGRDRPASVPRVERIPIPAPVR